MKNTATLLIVFFSFLLSACSTTHIDSYKYISEAHIKKHKLEKQKVDTPKVDFSYPAYLKAIEDNATDIAFKNFLLEGMALTRFHCLKVLNEVAENNHDNAFIKDEITVGTALATGFMAVNGASSDSFEKLALSSAFVYATSDLYRNYYLLGPNAPQVLKMVEEALIKQEKVATSSTPSTFLDAAKRLHAYATVCTSTNINLMVKQAISKANIGLPTQETSFLTLIARLKRTLGINAISASQISALDYVVELGTQELTDNKKIKELLGSINQKVLDNFSAIQNIFITLPVAVRQTIQQRDYFAQKLDKDDNGIMVVAEPTTDKEEIIKFVPPQLNMIDATAIVEVID